MGSGCLVPDDLIIEMMHLKLSGSGSYILDGYPRTMKQAQLMKEVDAALFISVDEDECVRRIVGRNQGRSDDNKETAMMRYRIYQKETLPVVEYLRDRKVLSEIDGNRSVEAIYGDIRKALDGLRN
ncbi:Uridylate kinase/adenylate kinase [Trachipleistophora hominis]|uniref:Uridylate kinase/adenylate kinase n=1 Tax=Trachipleistophora hominis TaxID=72359 RepID=L7JSX3_TRAHO|nr:Uridylate kinase/adenylate kinase [Trachipleistophora hominis]